MPFSRRNFPFHAEWRKMHENSSWMFVAMIARFSELGHLGLGHLGLGSIPPYSYRRSTFLCRSPIMLDEPCTVVGRLFWREKNHRSGSLVGRFCPNWLFLVQWYTGIRPHYWHRNRTLCRALLENLVYLSARGTLARIDFWYEMACSYLVVMYNKSAN